MHSILILTAIAYGSAASAMLLAIPAPRNAPRTAERAH
jgi:hypothetical protein